MTWHWLLLLPMVVIYLQDSGGAAPANILWGPFDFETTQACSAETDVSHTHGTVDCDCASGTGNCPIAGSESFRSNSDDNGQGALEWRNLITPKISSGVLVTDMLWEVVTVITAAQDVSMIGYKDGNPGRAGMYVNGTADGGSPAIAARDMNNTIGPYAALTTGIYRIRFAVGFGAADCTALGLTDASANGNCAGVWKDSVGNDYGTTLVSDQDGTAISGREVNGWVFGINLATSPDAGMYILDDMAICDEIPPAGGKCGDS